jgi:uncharacterized protein YkwD
MIRKAFVFSSFLMFLLSACGVRTTSTPTPVPPSATLPATIKPPTPTSPAASPTATAPAGPAGCTDAAVFVEDVTVPDFSHFNPRDVFTKTWRMKNVGSCTWTSDYKAVYARGDALGAARSIPLTQTAPGATIDISTEMTAPANDGKFQIFYHLSDPAGNLMPIDDGDSLWALITVGKVASSPAATPTSGPPSGAPGLGTVSCGYKANPDFVSQTLLLINAARASNNLPALAANSQLSTAAQFHSTDMACNDFLSHTGSDGSTVAGRIASAGYTASLTRENIYAQPPQYGGNPQSAVDWWMSDPIHQAAILNADVTEVGIGYAAYSRSTLGGYFTVDFAKP